MFPSLLASPFLSAFLACVSPAVAFIGLNVVLFSTRQIACSLVLLAVFGAAVGIALHSSPLPDLACAAVSLVLFLALSNRFFEEVLPARLPRILCQAGIVLLLSASTFAASFHVLNAVLAVYLLFGLADLVKNTRRIARAKGKNGESIIEEPATLEKTPNIYLLFLESVHSGEAVREIYKSGDFGLEEYLAARKFTIYENTYSNSESTLLSLADLLTMKINGSRHESYVLSTLKRNGYAIFAYDVTGSAFERYAPYFDARNFDRPPMQKFFFDWFAPILELLPAVKKLLGMGEDFVVKTSFGDVYAHVAEIAALKTATPKCCIARFGADHSPSNVRVSAGLGWMAYWKEQYLALYKKAASETMQMVDAITDSDPDACIIAVGDHGAAYYRFCKNADGRLIHVDEEISSSLVAKDAFSVLLGIRWPEGCAPFTGILSPVNIFRHLFRALGGKGEFLEKEAENESRFAGIPWIAARDGVPLDPWQRIDGAAVEAGYVSPQVAAAMNKMNEGRVPEAASLLLKTYSPDVPGHMRHLTLLASTLFRLGKASVAEDFLRAETERNTDTHGRYHFSVLLAEALFLQGNCETSARLLRNKPPYGTAPDILERREALQNRLLIAEGNFDAVCKRLPTWPRATFLRSLGQGEKALALVEREIGKQSGETGYAVPNLVHILLALDMGRHREAETLLRRYIASQNYVEPFVFCLLCGALERQEKHREAFAAMVQVQALFPENPFVSRELGMYLIRNKVAGNSLSEHKRAAYEGLRESGDLLARYGFFDAGWYCERYADSIGAMDPLRHYLLHRNILFLNPNPHFDCGYYVAMNPYITLAGMSPDEQYLLSPFFQGRNPSPIFFTDVYITRHPEAAQAGDNPLAHWMRTHTKPHVREKKEAA